jgi:hypothetical protein
MKVTARKVLHAGVIAGAALMLAAMSTLPTAGRAYAQDATAEASADAESPDIDVVGKWTGNIDDDSLGGGDMTLTIENQTKNNKIKGAWNATFKSFDVTGTFTGKVKATGATLELSGIEPKNKACKVKFTATGISESGISGNYKYAGCKNFKSDKGGTIELTPAP